VRYNVWRSDKDKAIRHRDKQTEALRRRGGGSNWTLA